MKRYQMIFQINQVANNSASSYRVKMLQPDTHTASLRERHLGRRRRVEVELGGADRTHDGVEDAELAGRERACKASRTWVRSVRLHASSASSC